MIFARGSDAYIDAGRYGLIGLNAESACVRSRGIETTGELAPHRGEMHRVDEGRADDIILAEGDRLPPDLRIP